MLLKIKILITNNKIEFSILLSITSIVYRNAVDRNDENGHHADPGR